MVNDKRVLDALTGAETVWMSVISLGEIYAGFRGGTKMLENQQQLDLFLAISRGCESLKPAKKAPRFLEK